MKIQCDVCNKDEASVYCSADEAALCAACDHRVHHANKLASKHPRFSLVSPTPKDYPLCDICKEKRAFVFCQQDRAILCKDCDIPIHKVNEHTQKHNRFLLTGVKLSETSAIHSPSPTSSSSTSSADGFDVVPDHHHHLTVNASKPTLTNNNSVSVSVSPSAIISNPNPPKTASTTTKNSNQFVNGSGYNGSNTSSISEYLIETLPGWHVEDFLDDPSLFCKSVDTGMMPFWDGDLLDGNLSPLSSENMGIWVPQGPPPPLPQPPISQQYSHPPNSNIMGSFGGYMGGSKAGGKLSNTKSSRKWTRSDDGFTVPQISPPSNPMKRSRTLW